MNCAKLLAPGLIALALAATGCGNECEECARGGSRGPDGANHGAGPNRGVVFDLGEYHAEVAFDHDRWECAVVFLTGDDKTARPLPVTASGLTLTTREARTKEGKVVAPMTIRLMPAATRDGKAARFVGRDPGLSNAVNFAGAVAAEIDGKPLRGEYRE
ncbi:MAG: hypothetical protein K2X87_17335 [Gemmataceae bacterium]|nr:hypothetical protein [Gemmataceae bacterium]